MTFHKAGPEAQARAAARYHADRATQTANVTARLLAAYRAHPDRAYAEDFYGSMLRERGVDPSAVVAHCSGCGCPLAAGHEFCSDYCATGKASP